MPKCWLTPSSPVVSTIATASYTRPLPFTFVLFSWCWTLLHICTVVKKRKWDSITPTICDNLHCLLVPQSIDFKICILVYKCLHQFVAPYPMSMMCPVSTVSTCRHLPLAFGRLGWPSCAAADQNNCLRSTKLFTRWSLSMEQCATKNQGWLKTEMFLRSYYASVQPS